MILKTTFFCIYKRVQMWRRVHKDLAPTGSFNKQEQRNVVIDRPWIPSPCIIRINSAASWKIL